MARKGNRDRGLFLRTYPSGEQVWWIRFSWQGRDIRRVGGATKDQARRTLRVTLADLQRGLIQLAPSSSDTLAAAIDRYRPLAERKRNYRKSQCFFTWWTTRMGKTALRSISPTLIEQAQSALLREGKSPATVNRYTDWLRHLLNREIRLGHLHSNPVSRVTRLKEADAPIHQYTREQERILMAALGPSGLWVRLAILTGLRQSEQFSIRKAWIHWEAGYIQIPTSKAHRPRVVLLTKEIAAIVRELSMLSKESPYLFPSPKFPNRPMDPGNWYRRVFKPACRKAGIPDDLKWHSMRHTFGSRLAASGASAQQIKALGGWTTDRASNRYIHLVQADLLNVAERLSVNLIDTDNESRQSAG